MKSVPRATLVHPEVFSGKTRRNHHKRLSSQLRFYHKHMLREKGHSLGAWHLPLGSVQEFTAHQLLKSREMGSVETCQALRGWEREAGEEETCLGWGLILPVKLGTSILAWRIPWTEKPGRLQSGGLQRVGHD